MSELFIFLSQGIAGPESAYRPGARHALILFATGDDMDDAQGHALAATDEHGWHHVEIARAKSLGDGPGGIDDPALRSSGEAAMEDGAAVVVYNDEMEPDA
ncbi:MAG: hypothetical protein AAF919_10430 [Pseudomonadota bacterium]